MSTTPNGLTGLSADTGTPRWLTTLISALLVVIPSVLAIWKPNGSFSSASAQALIVGIGVAAAGLVHLARLVAENGLKKAGIAKTITEEESWIKANWSDLTGTFTAAKVAVDTIPGVPTKLAEVSALAEDTKARVDAIPPTDLTALKALALTAISEQLNGSKIMVTNPDGSMSTVTIPAVAISTPEAPA